MVINNYETTFILIPGMENEAQEAIIEKFLSVINTNGGSAQGTDRIGLRKFAYEIKGKNEGFYVVIKFTGSRDTVAELDRIMKIQDEVLRAIIVNTTDSLKKEKAKVKS